MTLEFNTYARKPFVVEAVEVTEENFEEVAIFTGEIRHKDDGTRYIHVNRRLVQGNVWRVYPGFFMTRMGDAIRCYSRRVFLEQFVEVTSEVQAAANVLNKPSKPRVSVEVTAP